MIRNSTDRRDVRGRRSRTVAVPGIVRERGQTTQDFAIGIGIFLLAVAFVFTFLPSIATPYDTATGGAETAQADRIADRIVYDLSSSEAPNRIDDVQFAAYDGKETYELADEWGLRADSGDEIAFDRINVTVQELDGDISTASQGVGDEYDGQSAASSARIVTLESEPDNVYRLVVRVW